MITTDSRAGILAIIPDAGFEFDGGNGSDGGASVVGDPLPMPTAFRFSPGDDGAPAFPPADLARGADAIGLKYDV